MRAIKNPEDMTKADLLAEVERLPAIEAAARDLGPERLTDVAQTIEVVIEYARTSKRNKENHRKVAALLRGLATLVGGAEGGSASDSGD